MTLSKRVFFIRYALIFSLVLFVVLASVYYNVGTGLRQRVMLYPPLFSVLVAAWVMRRQRIRPLSARPVAYQTHLTGAA